MAVNCSDGSGGRLFILMPCMLALAHGHVAAECYPPQMSQSIDLAMTSGQQSGDLQRAPFGLVFVHIGVMCQGTMCLNLHMGIFWRARNTRDSKTSKQVRDWQQIGYYKH